MSTCEMEKLTSMDGDTRTCGAPAVGTMEDVVRVCRECGEAMERAGFRVDYDTLPSNLEGT